jgi:hypothetical protein
MNAKNRFVIWCLTPFSSARLSYEHVLKRHQSLADITDDQNAKGATITVGMLKKPPTRPAKVATKRLPSTQRRFQPLNALRL